MTAMTLGPPVLHGQQPLQPISDHGLNLEVRFYSERTLLLSPRVPRIFDTDLTRDTEQRDGTTWEVRAAIAIRKKTRKPMTLTAVNGGLRKAWNFSRYLRKMLLVRKPG